MRRREFELALASFAGLAWTRVSAQPRTEAPKLAILSPEAPSNIEVNLKTAQQLGITIPPSILLRADQVIE